MIGLRSSSLSAINILGINGNESHGNSSPAKVRADVGRPLVCFRKQQLPWKHLVQTSSQVAKDFEFPEGSRSYSFPLDEVGHRIQPEPITPASSQNFMTCQIASRTPGLSNSDQAGG
jgi:hypothetical protein